MPNYNFLCDECESVFEIELSVNDDRSDLECPVCGSKNVARDFSDAPTCSSKKSGSCLPSWGGG